jgi:regulator of sirC expression with transglutaminase-like and TPR domain
VISGRGAPAPAVAAEPPPRRAPGSRLAQADRINAGEVTRTALQAWARGDSKMALALYKRVIQASPGYAPAWRGAGLVYEKLGEKAAARAAFQRYLQLAPSAPDAAGIRARLGPP